jgi:hypothetical protein
VLELGVHNVRVVVSSKRYRLLVTSIAVRYRCCGRRSACAVHQLHVRPRHSTAELRLAQSSSTKIRFWPLTRCEIIATFAAPLSRTHAALA